EHTTFIYPDTSFAEVEIGDRKQDDFYPQVKIKRWDNECNFSARLKTEHKNPQVVEEDGKIKWKNDDVEAHFYELDVDGDQLEEGGLEFEVVFHKKPKSNIVEFSIQTKELDFFYQAPLTPEELVDGRRKRPANVDGSYAVYHKTKRDNRYKTGKAFHIYRPHVVDSRGNETWADLAVDLPTETLTIIIPQDFLDHAKYPVYVDPTLGYSSIGATTRLVDTGEGIAGQFTMPSNPGNATPYSTQINVYTATSANITMAYWIDSGSRQRYTGIVGGSGWHQSSSFTGGALMVWGQTYLIGAAVNSDDVEFREDSEAGFNSYLDTNITYNPPGDLFNKDQTDSNYRLSAYLNYRVEFDNSVTDGFKGGDSANPAASIYNPSASDGVLLGDNELGTNRIRVQADVVTHTSAGVANQYFDLAHTVDPDHAFVLIHTTGKDSTEALEDPDEYGMRGEITSDGTQVHLVRSSRQSDLAVSYQVIECFNNEFSVQHSSSQVIFEDVNQYEDITISSVTVADSIVIISAGARYDADTRADLSFVTGELTSSTNLRIQRGRTTDNGEDTALYWQVVTFNDPNITVQTGEKDTSGDISSGTTATISSVDTSRAWVFTTYRVTSTSGNEAGFYVRTKLTDSTTLTFERYTTLDKASYVRWFVIEWPEDVTVERHDTSFTTDTIKDVTVSTYDTTKAFADISVECDDSGGTTDTPVGFFYVEHLNSTTIRHRRYVSTNTPSGVITTQLIDFSGWYYGGSPSGELVPGESISDGFKLGDSAAIAVTVNASPSDGVDFSDSTTILATINAVVSDGIEFSDLAAVIAAMETALSDGVILSDETAPNKVEDASASDGMIFGDSNYSWIGFLDFAEDGFELGDTPAEDFTFNPSVSDILEVGDTPTAIATINGNLTDGVIFGEVLTPGAAVDANTSDGVDFGDSSIATFNMSINASDGVIFGDLSAAEATIYRNVTDGIEFGDISDVTALIEALVSDGVDFGDQVSAILLAITTITDGIVFEDLPEPIRKFAEFAYDGINFGDEIDLATTFVIDLTDGMLVGEIIISDLGGRVVYLDARLVSYDYDAEWVQYDYIARPVAYRFVAKPAQAEPASEF
ncbi:MAG: hypothetical protein PVI03_03580, partial [Candidatus Thorarchaeota archaeon]